MRTVLIAILVLMANSSGVIAQVDPTNQDVPIQIRLKPDKNTIMLGEPLFISFEITNVSGEKLCVGLGADYRNKFGRPDSFKVSVRTDDGAELPQLEVVTLGGFFSCHPIEAGGTYTVRLFLPHWANIERRGSYQVNVKRQMSFSRDEPSGSRVLKYSIPADVNAEFVVIPSEQNRIGEIISSLGSIMLDSSDPRSAESALALAYIHDERVISYFAEALRKFRDSEFGLGPFNELNIASNSIVALAKYDDDRAMEALEAAMKSKSDSTRGHVATVLQDSPHRSAVKLLLRMQNDSDWFVRLRVAQGLATVKTKEARAVLEKLLKDEDEHVREASKESLKKIDP